MAETILKTTGMSTQLSDLNKTVKVSRVAHHSSRGGRPNMEDYLKITSIPDSNSAHLQEETDMDLDMSLNIGYTYVGIFDGHGGDSASRQASTHLENYITSHKDFDSEDDHLVLKAIKDGYLNLQRDMLLQRHTWPKSPSGRLSNCGTTATIVFIKNGKLYIGHVGDSAIILGYEDSDSHPLWKAKQLTTDHKPDSPAELKRILSAGGKVFGDRFGDGEPRIVYDVPVITKGGSGRVTRSTPTRQLPFLNVARSLGDFWSYNPAKEEYIVSPVPDTMVLPLDPNVHRCLILGSDGLWNALSPEHAVNIVYSVEMNGRRRLRCGRKETGLDAAKRLVKRALDNWARKKIRADNTSAVVVVFE
ncbi:unnamed protein product [Orchesella dallaii]|uniref:PPM-type phosphatase domain-containing protein n=1 Tax=Orchesella dallaii TaxID=48710 RepID=A0ABP1S9Q1_9HEXA